MHRCVRVCVCVFCSFGKDVLRNSQGRMCEASQGIPRHTPGNMCVCMLHFFCGQSAMSILRQRKWQYASNICPNQKFLHLSVYLYYKWPNYKRLSLCAVPLSLRLCPSPLSSLYSAMHFFCRVRPPRSDQRQHHFHNFITQSEISAKSQAYTNRHVTKQRLIRDIHFHHFHHILASRNPSAGERIHQTKWRWPWVVLWHWKCNPGQLWIRQVNKISSGSCPTGVRHSSSSWTTHFWAKCDFPLFSVHLLLRDRSRDKMHLDIYIFF